MCAEDLLIDDSSNGKTIETVCERLPEFDVVSALTLIVETVDTVNRSTFVIASKDEEVFRIFHFVR